MRLRHHSYTVHCQASVQRASGTISPWITGAEGKVSFRPYLIIESDAHELSYSRAARLL